MILCLVFFLVPFSFRGARMAVKGIKNDVRDWLPADFPETRVLDWFREYFSGDAFVVVSWPGEANGSERCSEGNFRFDVLTKKLRAESLEAEKDMTDEEIIAHNWGDRLGLHTTGDFHEDWGQNGEKWLMGHQGQWYYITKDGGLYRWDGENNVISGIRRSVFRFFNEYNVATGEKVHQFGKPKDNIYHKEPSRLFARFFKGVLTGPDVVKSLAGEGGPLRKNNSEYEAKLLAHKRLNGSLYGPTPSPDFPWNKESFAAEVGEATMDGYPKGIEENFQEYVDQVVQEKYKGDLTQLVNAPSDERLEHWFNFFYGYKLEPPPRTTCILVSLNRPAVQDLARVVGRPVMGKPMGRIFQLAKEANLIKKYPHFAADLHLGGPPSDNVAIDEEGTITLIRLVGFSTLIGWILAYISFRSVKISFMVFFVGGISAISSLGIVWYGKSSLDAILMSMPSLVYVLGLSGAVHVVNYYREACRENGPEGAAETAVRHGFFPCALAALTTSLGLISLYVSNLTPIKKFGLFSAIGVLITVVLLFTYLPASLQLWPPGYKKREENNKQSPRFNLFDWIESFWDRVGGFVVRYNALVTAAILVCLVYFAIGIFNIKTSVKLTKLFDEDAKVIKDYEWLESNLGKLVPMEVVLRVNEGAQQPFADDEDAPEISNREKELRFSMLERLELSKRVRSEIDLAFGELGKAYVGNGMDTSVFVPVTKQDAGGLTGTAMRDVVNTSLEETRAQFYELGYFKEEKNTQEELWRISLRLAALNDVDYGEFVSDLKTVVEPVIAAYEYRTKILDNLIRIAEKSRTPKSEDVEESLLKGRVLFLGWRNEPNDQEKVVEDRPVTTVNEDGQIDQTRVFCRTISALFANRGFTDNSASELFFYGAENEKETDIKSFKKEGAWQKATKFYDCVVLLRDHPAYDVEYLKEHSRSFVDARNHTFKINHQTKQTISKTSADRVAAGENLAITAEYTGIVPIVYKAQRTLLKSLINSICLAFVMIALVMMILLRDWNRPASLGNTLNLGGGMVSMLPNIFPVVLIFGAMGHFKIAVDIGSMMTASVAMGVAVDDTIHFLAWFRKGLYEGLDRKSAIRKAYKHVATAMTQTTLIGGLGLSVFALSTFTPTQRFGVLMLILLITALVGDLIFLPALLAGPLGKLFKVKPRSNSSDGPTSDLPEEFVVENVTTDSSAREQGVLKYQTPHSAMRRSDVDSVLRRGTESGSG